MKKNGYQEFDERESLKRAKELNMQLIRSLEEFNSISKHELDARIEKLEEIIEIYETLKEEAFDFDETEYKRIKEKLEYLKFRKQYLEEFSIDEISKEELKEYAKSKKQQDEENMKKYRKEKLKEKADENKDLNELDEEIRDI